MKIYEIRVETVDFEWGRHTGYKTIGFAIDKKKADEAAKKWAEENEVNEWWCCYGQNKEGHINVEVIDRGTVIE